MWVGVWIVCMVSTAYTYQFFKQSKWNVHLHKDHQYANTNRLLHMEAADFDQQNFNFNPPNFKFDFQQSLHH